jgi:hypothetical protein
VNRKDCSKFKVLSTIKIATRHTPGFAAGMT